MNEAEKRLREAVRTALNAYLVYLELQSDRSDADVLDITVSITQLESAKRVLWMED